MNELSDRCQLIHEADRRLEANDFTHARDAYRAAALMGPPGDYELTNLTVAEAEERLAFRRHLKEQFPDSFEASMSEAAILMDIGRMEQAVALCTDMLDRFSEEPHYSLHIRLARYRAAVWSHNYDLLYEDFLFIWTAGQASEPAKRLRVALLRLLAEVRDVEAIPTFNRLAKNCSDPVMLQVFLQAKSRELTALADVTRVL